ncbi:MAG: hypothetical protein K2J63_05440, partial [Muribaculaceae bacterium]|nr:hypothetical protein [Muribaculaceae bacterium]
MILKGNDYIFRAKYGLIIVLLVLLSYLPIFICCLWIDRDDFPFGSKEAILMFLGVICLSFTLIFGTYSFFRHPTKLIINDEGIYYQTPKPTLKSFTLWEDTLTSYDWRNIKTFCFDWCDPPARGTYLINLVLLDGQNNKVGEIMLNALKYTRAEIIEVIDFCTRQKVTYDPIATASNRRKLPKLYFRNLILPILIALLILTI